MSAAANKRILYVGGLADEVNEKVVLAAFQPFGDVVDVNLPVDFASQKHRGFAFVEFESAQDAADAIDNMNESEIYGRTIRVNIAKPSKLKENSARAIWADDAWLREHAGTKLTDSSSVPQTQAKSPSSDEGEDSE